MLGVMLIFGMHGPVHPHMVSVKPYTFDGEFDLADKRQTVPFREFQITKLKHPASASPIMEHHGCSVCSWQFVVDGTVLMFSN